MRKVINTIDIQNRIDEKQLKFSIIEYNGYGKKSTFIHSCGFQFEMRIDHLLNRGKCPKCDTNKYTMDSFQLKSNEVHSSEYKILEFKGVNNKIKALHLKCGNTLNIRGCNHLRGDACAFCYGNKKYSNEDILKLSKDRWGSEYTILSKNSDYNKKSLIRHNKCGNEFKQKISFHLLKGGCQFCAGNNRHTLESVQKKSNEVHNNEYIILSQPMGSFNKIKIKHKLCNKEFMQVLDTHIRGCGCPKCNSSKGEKFIEKLLIDNNIKFETQKTFNECRYKHRLKFDFYLPEYKICIEYDGIQHFKPIRWFGGTKSYKLQVIKDNIKNEYCQNNNISLVRFRYDEDFKEIYDNMMKTLKKYMIK